MNQPSSYTSIRLLLLAASLALLLVLAATPALAADDSTSVSVTAEIVGEAEITINVCDSSADFGSGLSSSGAPSLNTFDTVYATTPGSSGSEGVFYVWTPTCEGDNSAFFEVESSLPWSGTVCATDSVGTSSLRIDDLFWHNDPTLAPQSYAGALSQGIPFSECLVGLTYVFELQGAPGLTGYYAQYYLKVDAGESAGAFDAATTWEVSN